MKQVFNSDLRPIKGLFRKADGSLVAVDPTEFSKRKIAADKINSMQRDIEFLKEQLTNLTKR